jgi:uncharacterized protein (DUF2062 family)
MIAMRNRSWIEKIRGIVRYVLRKLVRTNDTPQKVAVGAGIGVFTGILPGAGPFAAYLIATAVKANKASALVFSAVTNTWLSVVLFVTAIHTGSIVCGLRWQDVYNRWLSLKDGFSWRDIFHTSMADVVIPIAAGFLINAVCAAILVYVCVFIAVNVYRKRRQKNKTAGDV